MVEPRIDNEAVRQQGKIVAALRFAGTRRWIVIVPVAAYVTTKARNYNLGAIVTAGGWMIASGKTTLVTSKPFERSPAARAGAFIEDP